MINEIEELINQIDPDKNFCECCEKWEMINNFYPIQVLNSTCSYHIFCFDCSDKIRYINNNKQFLRKEIEDLYHLYVYKRDCLYKNINENESYFLSFSYYKKLISYFNSYKNYIEN
jgi:hypothetical protein